MKNSKIYLSSIFLGLIIFSAGASADHSWGGYHWARKANPFTLKLGNNLTTAVWQQHLTLTSADWNNNPTSYATVLQTSIVPGTSTKRCKAVIGTTQVCNGNYGFNGWLGLASIYLASGSLHITQGTAKMNDSYFNTATYNNVNERQHVMCQEVAHTFGLDHQDESGISLNTCMDYFSNTGVNAGNSVSTTPNAHDFEELSVIYGHLDASSTIASTTAVPSVELEVTNAPNSWGKLVSQSHNGRSSTYERVYRDGSRALTHVFWTDEAASKCASCDHRFDH